MTAVAQPAARVVISAPRARFFPRMAYVCAAVGVLGFTPTYWVPLLSGTLDVPPILHLHASVFYAWLALFVVQSRLAAGRRLSSHRELGVASVAVVTAMCFVGTAAAVEGIRLADAAGFGARAVAFSVVPLTGVFLFAAMFAVALLYVKRPDIHKRLLLVATVGLLNAPVGRLFALAMGAPPPSLGVAPPPIAVTVPAGLLTDLLLVPALLHDWRTRGRVHPAYWIGGGIVVASQLLRAPIGGTSAWQAFVGFVTRLVP